MIGQDMFDKLMGRM